MAQALSCTSIMGMCNVTLKKFSFLEYKIIDPDPAFVKKFTSRASYEGPLFMSSWGHNPSINSSSLLISQNLSALNSHISRKTICAAYSTGKGLPGSSNYIRLGGCLVLPPSPIRKKARGIIKFLGGAFIGAVPELSYSLLMDLLAKEGFLVIAVPYNVTFDHAQAAKEVYNKFNSCMDILLASGLSSANLTPNNILELPVYCVGHSNGALLQLLEGCYFEEKLQKANVLIAFNNKPAAEAVPYFEQVGPAAAQFSPFVEASPFYEMARNTSGDALRTMMEVAGPMLEQYNPEAILSLTRFTEQIPSVMNQITQGTSEFTPTPSENREIISTGYKVPRTLLVKFNFDAIDETDQLESVLRPRVDKIGGILSKVVLNGTHLTPCGQDLNWQVGDSYTPADAVAQVLKAKDLYLFEETEANPYNEEHEEECPKKAVWEDYEMGNTGEFLPVEKGSGDKFRHNIVVTNQRMLLSQRQKESGGIILVSPPLGIRTHAITVTRLGTLRRIVGSGSMIFRNRTKSHVMRNMSQRVAEEQNSDDGMDFPHFEEQFVVDGDSTIPDAPTVHGEMACQATHSERGINEQTNKTKELVLTPTTEMVKELVLTPTTEMVISLTTTEMFVSLTIVELVLTPTATMVTFLFLKRLDEHYMVLQGHSQGDFDSRLTESLYRIQEATQALEQISHSTSPSF
ncbi:hypothetical protein KI387_010090 [Taxus chinensis]|uniref:Uncharacterized protein n=1 Tax=Taxus chinensis TaxID=29808 RepID=A0AA38FKR6_TAXCH|nr:hypothetical protein KI387_010090 [Taxus chinensis]